MMTKDRTRNSNPKGGGYGGGGLIKVGLYPFSELCVMLLPSVIDKKDLLRNA